MSSDRLDTLKKARDDMIKDRDALEKLAQVDPGGAERARTKAAETQAVIEALDRAIFSEETDPSVGRPLAEGEDIKEDDKHWFQRTNPDGTMEPDVCIGDDGSILVLDNGWAASFKKGKWSASILFSHETIAEFTPVRSRQDVRRYFEEACKALGRKPT